MPVFALIFLLGDCLLQTAPTLPPLWPWALVSAVSASIALLVRKTFLLAFITGTAWSAYIAHMGLADDLAPALEGRNLEITGAIASIPAITAYSMRFVVDTQQRGPGIPSHIELSWFDRAAPIHPGEVWKLKVKLKRRRGFANPGGFDYERQLLSEGIGATGYVRESPENVRLSGPSWRYAVLCARAYIAQQLTKTLPSSPMLGLMRGLAVGDQQAITAAQWRVFARTGTTHLVAISGFHIGMVAAMVAFLGGSVARLPQAQRWRITRLDARAVSGIVGGTLYSALAGFSIPTQRTFIMLCIYFGARLSRRALSPSRNLALALISVLVLDPLGSLMPGFWLSFGAVALILLAIAGRLGTPSAWREHLRMQGVITLGLAPVLIALFGNLSLVAPFVNLLAIPFFSFVAVPGVLLGVLFLTCNAWLGGAILHFTSQLFEWIWPALEWAAGLPLATYYFAQMPWWIVLLAAMGAALAAAPGIAATRIAGMALCLPVLCWRAEKPSFGTFELTALDVGQGLALVVRTQTHVLLYDAGPSFRSGRDTGELVVVPYLHHFGLSKADILMLSHGDEDHVGGAKSILADIDVGRVVVGPSVGPLDHITELCALGQHWQWDGVEFSVLHPANFADGRDNNSSCVLEVRSVGGRALLMGDIEKKGEAELIEAGRMSPADIVVAAHHGSRTSSTPPFVEAVQARYVIFSSGWANRWDFPKADVVARWESAGATTLMTSHSGAIEMLVGVHGIERVSEYRKDHLRYWRN